MLRTSSPPAAPRVVDGRDRQDLWCASRAHARALAVRRARALGPGWTVVHDARPRPHFHLARVTRRADGRLARRRAGARYFYGGSRGRGAAGLLPAATAVPPERDAAWEAAAEERETQGPAPGPDQQLRAALAARRWPEAIAAAFALGTRDENALTDLVFTALHPERRGTPIARHETALAQEWRRIRDGVVRPALHRLFAAGPAGPPAATRVARSTTWLRRAWAEHLAEKTVRMVPLQLFGLRATPVHPYTVDAWRALERALTATGYRPRSVWNYVNRPITGGSGPSLHAYGIATDIDPSCNPYRVTPDRPVVRFSAQPTQDQRCAEVKAGRADTAFTPQQVAAVEAITTVDGLPVLAWGGRWRSVKDAMHFQVNVSPDELRRGLRGG
ncbi:D-alanyl-D-alanine carboxypeptidase [Geodermatophilus saharensis]|uniref:D-alanyl-D-alanine carboxypeptidase n=1 Tax=Geodermatophilus saharensis TaxID=1137994 RepID=A0A239IR93_9ACTN|nr:M15 family metallopeptidase [Geodermatophilus saharensis]SNS96089.1 D-alanyl-D-alanine carboxypeptidase [Geodermatophilus saharensis]